jgi:histidine phosphotransferase ChpT
LISRLCHDLASPVGAVVSGLELMAEFDGGAAEDALKLMGDSAQIAAHRLAFYRLAFGFAGNAANLGVGEVRRVASEFMAGGRVGLDWPAAPAADAHTPAAGGTKLMLMLIFVAAEALPRGGRLKVGLDPAAGAFSIEAGGAGARLAPIALTALAGEAVDDASLDAANAPACYAGRIAARLRVRLEVECAADRVRLAARLP